MNANTDIDLAVLHDAIVADIKAQFPQLITVEFYREDRKELPKPACLLELTEMEAQAEDDPGSEQLCVMASFEAQLIIGFRPGEDGTKSKLAIRLLAGALSAWLLKRRWNTPGFTGEPGTAGSKLPTGEALVMGAYRDDFRALGGQRVQDLEQYEVWRVEWQQRLHLGKTVWTDEGAPPAEVYSGWSPDIGTGNEDDYDQVIPE